MGAGRIICDQLCQHVTRLFKSPVAVCGLTVIAAALAFFVVFVAVLAAVAHPALFILRPNAQLEVGHGVVGVASQVAGLGRDHPTWMILEVGQKDLPFFLHWQNGSNIYFHFSMKLSYLS